MVDSQELLAVTSDLIRIPSTADRPRELERAIVYVRDFFSRVPGLIVKEYTSGGKPSLVVSTRETLMPDIILLGHLDVVPAESSGFEPRVEGGRLYGRGACDMKGPDAVMMMLMREIALRDAVEQSNIALMFTTDEEIGGKHGAHYLVDVIGYRARVVIAPDGGNRPDQVVHHNKGGLVLRLVATGKAGHGARPWLGDNAIHRLMSAYKEVHALFPESAHEDSWNNTCNIGMIEGGAAANQIPARASCTIDVRVLTSAQATMTLDAICVIAAAHQCEVEVIEAFSTSFTDPTNGYIQLYAHAVQETLGRPAQFIRSHGADDGRFFSAHGIPVICSRPTSGDQHSEGEWVETESLGDFYMINKGFVLSQLFKHV